MNDSLTPTLIIQAVELGMMDTALEQIADAVRDRKEIIRKRRAAVLNKGDKFVVVNCSPKYWNDLEVEFQRRDGMWLVCKTITWHRKVPTGNTVRLRESHVGPITYKAGV